MKNKNSKSTKKKETRDEGEEVNRHRQLSEEEEEKESLTPSVRNEEDFKYYSFRTGLVIGLTSLLLGYCVVAPYTKVEESFNIQACHDLLSRLIGGGEGGSEVDEYDHLQYPGVVPRTFIGNLILSGLTYLVHTLLSQFPKLSSYSLLFDKKLSLLITVRGILGLSVLYTWLQLGRRFGRHFGLPLEVWYLLFTLVQFHPLFWGSRLLPNMFALVLTNMGLASWLDSLALTTGPGGRNYRQRLPLVKTFLRWMIPAGVIFRSEVAFFTGFIILVDLVRSPSFYLSPRRFYKLFKTGLSSIIVSLAATVLVDSHFWKGTDYVSQRGLLWPEGYVFFFNAVLGKSEEWGISPFHSYFTSFLPKVLGLAYGFTLLGLSYTVWSKLLGRVGTKRRSQPPTDATSHPIKLVYRSLVLPSLLYVVFMSCLGHKEWRFLVYCFPIFNLAAASSLSALLNFMRTRSVFSRRLFQLLVTSLFTLSLLATFLMVFLSSLNYPGGEALRLVHEIAEVRQDHSPRIHIHVTAAMTGVSRFGQVGSHWSYEKNETLTPSDYHSYRYLITPPTVTLPDFQDQWERVGVAYGLTRVTRQPLNQWAHTLTCTSHHLIPYPLHHLCLSFSPPPPSFLPPRLPSNLTPLRRTLLTTLELLLPLRIHYTPHQHLLRHRSPSPPPI